MTDTQLDNYTATRPITRIKKIPTNLNGKLACQTFIHLQIGVSTITESQAENTIFQFRTEDNSHPPVNARLFDSIRQPLQDISGTLTLLSHNMTREEFITKTLAAVQYTTLQTEIVAYFYRVVKE